MLSAGETGLGQFHVGEGVFGLRRAFVLAGASPLVMSLWKILDEPTRELMEEIRTPACWPARAVPRRCASGARAEGQVSRPVLLGPRSSARRLIAPGYGPAGDRGYRRCDSPVNGSWRLP